MALVAHPTYANIMIDDNGGGASTFVATCTEAINKIAATPGGLALMTALNNGPVFAAWGGSVKIVRRALAVDQGGSEAVPTNNGAALGGGGSASAVFWNSNIFVVPGQGPRPPFIGLAHELVHAWHNAMGTKKPNYDEEERFTVGLGAYVGLANGATITENLIRVENDVPLRHQY